jgi:hypothetical protein
MPQLKSRLMADVPAKQARPNTIEVFIDTRGTMI